MSHTPGTWNIEPIGSSKVQININGEDNTPVATAWRLESWPNTPIEANARLIAAAPDLLAACDLAEDYLNRAGHTEDDSTRGGTALYAIRAAIAKAKGETT